MSGSAPFTFKPFVPTGPREVRPEQLTPSIHGDGSTLSPPRVAPPTVQPNVSSGPASLPSSKKQTAATATVTPHEPAHILPTPAGKGLTARSFNTASITSAASMRAESSSTATKRKRKAPKQAPEPPSPSRQTAKPVPSGSATTEPSSAKGKQPEKGQGSGPIGGNRTSSGGDGGVSGQGAIGGTGETEQGRSGKLAGKRVASQDSAVLSTSSSKKTPGPLARSLAAPAGYQKRAAASTSPATTHGSFRPSPAMPSFHATRQHGTFQPRGFQTSSSTSTAGPSRSALSSKEEGEISEWSDSSADDGSPRPAAVTRPYAPFQSTSAQRSGDVRLSLSPDTSEEEGEIREDFESWRIGGGSDTRAANTAHAVRPTKAISAPGTGKQLPRIGNYEIVGHSFNGSPLAMKTTAAMPPHQPSTSQAVPDASAGHWLSNAKSTKFNLWRPSDSGPSARPSVTSSVSNSTKGPLKNKPHTSSATSGPGLGARDYPDPPSSVPSSTGSEVNLPSTPDARDHPTAVIKNISAAPPRRPASPAHPVVGPSPPASPPRAADRIDQATPVQPGSPPSIPDSAAAPARDDALKSEQHGTGQVRPAQPTTPPSITGPAAAATEGDTLENRQPASTCPHGSCAPQGQPIAALDSQMPAIARPNDEAISPTADAAAADTEREPQLSLAPTNEESLADEGIAPDQSGNSPSLIPRDMDISGSSSPAGEQEAATPPAAGPPTTEIASPAIMQMPPPVAFESLQTSPPASTTYAPIPPASEGSTIEADDTDLLPTPSPNHLEPSQSSSLAPASDELDLLAEQLGRLDLEHAAPAQASTSVATIVPQVAQFPPRNTSKGLSPANIMAKCMGETLGLRAPAPTMAPSPFRGYGQTTIPGMLRQATFLQHEVSQEDWLGLSVGRPMGQTLWDVLAGTTATLASTDGYTEIPEDMPEDLGLLLRLWDHFIHLVSVFDTTASDAMWMHRQYLVEMFLAGVPILAIRYYHGLLISMRLSQPLRIQSWTAPDTVVLDKLVIPLILEILDSGTAPLAAPTRWSPDESAGNQSSYHFCAEFNLLKPCGSGICRNKHRCCLCSLALHAAVTCETEKLRRDREAGTDVAMVEE